MPIYEFRCTGCRAISDFMDRDHVGDLCPHCQRPLKRKFSFALKATMPEHFNAAAGAYVSNERELKDEFKRQSEHMTHYTGIEHNIVPVDLNDKEALGVTDEGLDSTHDRAVAEGRKEATGHTTF